MGRKLRLIHPRCDRRADHRGAVLIPHIVLDHEHGPHTSLLRTDYRSQIRIIDIAPSDNHKSHTPPEFLCDQQIRGCACTCPRRLPRSLKKPATRASYSPEYFPLMIFYSDVPVFEHDRQKPSYSSSLHIMPPTSFPFFTYRRGTRFPIRHGIS